MLSCSPLTTCAGITRNTAIGPLRSRAAFTRKRARPPISYAKSESPVSFHSPRLRSGMTDRSMTSSWSDESGAVAWRFISPWVRNTGGSPTRRCRSDEADWTSALSSSPRARSAARYCGAAKSPGNPAGGAGAAGAGAAAGPAAAARRDPVVAGALAGRVVSTIGAAGVAQRLRGRGGFAAGPRRLIDGRHHCGQASHVGYDPHAHEAPVGCVVELRLRHLIDVV